MHSLLTGKFVTAEHSSVGPDPMVEESWTAEAHLAAMRRLLDTASKNSGVSADTCLAAARIHAEAAKTAGRTPTPVKTAPATTAPSTGRVRINTEPRTVPRDGDTI